MADWLFDGSNKIVYEPTGSGDTSFNVERDLYSAWKRWVSSGDGSRYSAAFSPEGGTPIGNTGIFTGKTIVLINGWKVRAANHDHQVTLNGNLFSDDGVVSVPTESFNTAIFVNSSVAAQGIATGSAVTQQDKDDIANNINSQLSDIKQRLDLLEPNTYRNDNSQIDNEDFTLNKVDNGNGTFNIVRTDK